MRWGRDISDRRQRRRWIKMNKNTCSYYRSAGRRLFRKGGCLKNLHGRVACLETLATPQTCIVPIMTKESHDVMHVDTENHENHENHKTTRFSDNLFVNYPFLDAAISSISKQNCENHNFHEIVWWRNIWQNLNDPWSKLPPFGTLIVLRRQLKTRKWEENDWS